MENPLSSLYANMHFLKVIPCNMLTMSTFIPNLPILVIVPMVLFTHAFHCKDYKSYLVGIDFLSLLFKFFFHESYPAWVVIEYNNHSKLFAYIEDNEILFGMDSYQIPSCLIPYKYGHFYTFSGF
jgi:hypothetical protein